MSSPLRTTFLGPRSQLFQHLKFVLVVGDTSAEAKRLKKLIQEHDGTTSYTMSAQVHCVIASVEEVEKGGSKIRSAIQKRRPIVSAAYLDDCVAQNSVLDITPIYLLVQPSWDDNDDSEMLLSQSSDSMLGFSTELIQSDPLSSSAGDIPNTGVEQPANCFLLSNPSGAREPVKEIRIFVSSTFKDMAIEREQLVKSVFPELRQLCLERGVFFSYVDLRWGITEEDSRDGQTLNLCLNEIDHCRPYFLCMLGERYGWHQPIGAPVDVGLDKTFQIAADAFPWTQKLKDRSITELEIRHAILNTFQAGDHATSSRMRCAFYFRDPRSTFINELPDGPASARAESIDAQTKVNSLKAEIRAAKLHVRDYKNATQFAHLVLDDLRASIVNDLTLVENAAKQITPGSFESLKNDYACHVTYAKHRSVAYVASEELMRRVQSFALKSSSVCPMVIHGESGIGKSALVSNWFLREQANLEEKYAEFYASSEEERRKQIKSEFPPLILAHFVASSPEAADPIRIHPHFVADIMRRVMTAIRVHFSLAMSLPDRDEDITREFPYWLQTASDRGRLVIVLDAIDQLSTGKLTISRAASNAFLGESDQSSSKEEFRLSTSNRLDEAASTDAEARALTWLPLQFPSNVQLIVTCSSPSMLSHLIRTRGWNNHSLQLPGLSPSDKSQLVAGYLKIFGKKLSSMDQNTLVSAKLSSSPLFLRAVMDELRSGAVFENLSRQIESYAASNSVSELYGKILTRWERDYNGLDSGNKIVNKALSYIWASRKGLSEAELIEILGIDNRASWTKLFVAIRESLVSHGGLLKFYHQHLSSAVANRYFGSETTIADAHRKLADYFCGDMVPNHRKVDELPYHLEKCRDTTRLRAFLLDQRYFPALYEQSKTDVFHYWHFVEDANSDIAQAYLDALNRFNASNPASDILASSIRAVAKFLEEIGEYQKANKTFHQALYADSSLHGQWHEITAGDLFYLALTYFHLADLVSSKNYARQALDMRTHVMGPEHLDTAESINLLALIHKKEANYERARDLYSEAIRIARTALGSQHAKLAYFLFNLGDVYRKLADFDNAEKCYAQALEIARALHGPNSIQVADILNSMGLVYKKKGDYGNSERAYQEATTIVVAFFGAEHPKTAMLSYNLADVYRKTDQFDRAESLYLRSLTIAKRTYGDSHPEVAEIYNDLGLLKKKEGKYEDATKYHKTALQIVETALGPMHPKVGMYLSNLADVERKKSQFDSAEELYRQALGIVEKAYGPSHIEVAEVLNSMGLVLKKRALYDQAQPLYERALNIVQRQLGITHPKVGIYLNNLADIHRKRCSYQTALTLYKRSLLIIKETLGKEHSEAADVYNNMALVHASLGDQRKAIKLYQKAIQIISKELGPRHFKVGIFKANLGDSHLLCSEEEEAQNLYEDALSILEEALGKSHVEVADVLIKLGAHLQSRGQYKLAHKHWIRAQGIISQTLGTLHPKFKQCEKATDEIATREPSLAK